MPRGIAMRRYLPVDGLTRPVLAEVLASSEGDRRQAHPAWRVKVWIGMLRADLVPAVVFGRSAEAMTFGTAEEDAEVVFVIAGSGGGPGDLQRPRPMALFVCCGQRSFRLRVRPGSLRGGGGRLPEVGCHGAAIGKLQSGMEALLARLPAASARDGPAADAGLPIQGSLGGKPKPGLQPLPGLDPAVVKSARQAGVPEAQLQRMSALVSGARRLPAEPQRPGAPVLDDEELVQAPDGGGVGTASTPLDHAVLKMSEILQLMHRDRRGGSLEEVLDRAEGSTDPAGTALGGGRSKAAAYQKLRNLLRSSPAEISKLIETQMNEDFAAARSGPGLEGLQCSARAWIEHRSFHGPIRQAWTLGGIIDALNGNDPERAKAVALLALASLDQAAVDSGSWLLASEISLEGAPPFGAFARPRVLDQFEAKQSRLLDNRLVSILMSRIRDRGLFHTAKKNLGSSAGGPGFPPGGPPGGGGSGGGGESSNPDKPPKGKGKGKEKEGNRKQGDK
eukprot:s7398_g5.t1